MSLSVALPVVWTEAQRRGFSLADIMRWMSEAPARLAGCEDRKGRLAPGHDADFVVFDPEAEFMVAKERVLPAAPVSPYVGESCEALSRRRICGGRPCLRTEQISGGTGGKEFRL